MRKLILFFLILGCIFSDEITFKDELNNTVKLKSQAKRVVSFPIPLAPFSISVDKSIDRLISINPISLDSMNNGILGKIFPNSKNLSTAGIGADFVPNVEELIRLKPDLVFQWAHMGAKIVDPMKKVGVNLALFKYGTEENAINWFNIIGKAYGKEDRVKDILEQREKFKQALIKQTKDIKDKPKVLYFIRYKSLTVPGTDTYSNYSIGLAGGKSVATHTGIKPISIEQIISYDPDIILLNNFEHNLSPKDVYNNKLLKNLKAVKNKAVYISPLGGERWDPPVPSQESPLAWIWLNRVFFGKSSFNLKEEIKDVYKMLYGYVLNEEEIKEILHYDLNKFSKDYTNILD